MRQIKFRVWDKKYNCFLEEPFFRITISKNGKIHNSENDTWYDYDERYVIELFTGLLDKNGKEIWEGDIYEDLKTGMRWSVIHMQGCFFFSNQDDNFDMPLHMVEQWERLVHKGNIHETL